MTIEKGPEAGGLAQCSLAAPARHRHRKQTTIEHGLFDLRHHLQMISAPRQVIGLGTIALAEHAKAFSGCSSSFGITRRMNPLVRFTGDVARLQALRSA